MGKVTHKGKVASPQKPWPTGKRARVAALPNANKIGRAIPEGEGKNPSEHGHILEDPVPETRGRLPCLPNEGEDGDQQDINDAGCRNQGARIHGNSGSP